MLKSFLDQKRDQEIIYHTLKLFNTICIGETGLKALAESEMIAVLLYFL